MCRPVCKCRTNNGGRQKQNGEEWGEGEIEEDEGRESCMDLSLSFWGAGTAFILKYRLNGGVGLRYMAVDALKMQFSRRCQISYNSAVCVLTCICMHLFNCLSRRGQQLSLLRRSVSPTVPLHISWPPRPALLTQYGCVVFKSHPYLMRTFRTHNLFM